MHPEQFARLARGLLHGAPSGGVLCAFLDGGGAPVERVIRVGTYDGDLDVTLRAPCKREVGGSPFDLLAELGELGKDGEEIGRAHV